jgi:putative membrane protein
MEDIAHANLAEVETGKLALEKSKNEQVRQFAQRMIDDHTTALKELQTLAQSRGVTLPTETDVQHKTIATALKALSGDTFDHQYMERVGIGDHERTHDLLQKAVKNARDADLKAYAQKTLKTVDQHLSMAKKMETKK